MHPAACPALCIVCAPLPAGGHPVSGLSPTGAGRESPNISWYGPLNRLEASAEWSAPTALAIDPQTAASRRDLRLLLRAAHQTFPNLRAAVLQGPEGIVHPELMVEEGIAVVLASQFGSPGRPRRPAPAGWPCRSVQWGLWELLRQPAATGSWTARLFGGGSLSRLKPGRLLALDAADANGSHDARRLRGVLSQLGPQLRAGSVLVPPLAALPELISGGSARQAPGSILRAA